MKYAGVLVFLVAVALACADERTQEDGGELSSAVLDAHRAVARRAAAESLVLLENNGALPLDRKASVALFGSWQTYQVGGGGSALVKPSRTVGFKEGLEEAGLVVDQSSRETAVYVLFRSATEGKDLRRSDFELTKDERREMAEIRQLGFGRIVLVVNGGLLPDVSPWTKSGLVDAALFTWYPGQEGCAAIGDILTGRVNPSGRLANTEAKSLSDYASDETFQISPEHVPYEDDIFVGYRYFETIPNAAEKVVYPFGHGLSYSTFAVEPLSFSAAKGHVSVRVRVVNTGKCAGKTSVLLYSAQAEGMAEHPARELRAFGKSALILPGGSDELLLSFARDDLAVFDDEGWSGHVGSWVLDKGKYSFLVGGDVRSVREAGFLNVQTPQVLSTPGFKCNPALLARRLRADGRSSSVPVTYLGKKGVDWQYPGDFPTNGVARLMLADVAAGRATLDAFIDQLTLEEMLQLTHGYLAEAKGGTGGIGILRKYGLCGVQTCDGPCGVRRALPSTAFPCAALIACAFDPALTREIGRAIGAEAAEANFDLLLAPGLCIQRHPLCGRNFEYFSEDPCVSGVLASEYVKGVQSTGVGATVKHFACNNRETNRRLSNAVVGERALREIYLRGFERAVRDAKPWAVMSSYNQINGVNSTINHGLLEGILRDEWGFDGVVMSDWYTIFPMWREIDAGNDVKMSHDLELYTEQATWRTGVGERNSVLARKCQNEPFSYLYRDELRESVARICRLVMRSRRFRRER